MKYIQLYRIIEKMQYKFLGQYIKYKRIKAGYTLNAFAIANDIDSAILSRIENLKQNIKLNILEKITNGFSQTPAEFLTEFEQTKSL